MKNFLLYLIITVFIVNLGIITADADIEKALSAGRILRFYQRNDNKNQGKHNPTTTTIKPEVHYPPPMGSNETTVSINSSSTVIIDTIIEQ